MYSNIRICPAGRLSGKVCVPSAKNSVLPLIAAALLCSGEVVLQKIPRLSDVETACAMARALGADAVLHEQPGTAGLQLKLDATGVFSGLLPDELMQRMRSGVFFLAPALHRTGRVIFHHPGGCNLGARPVDIHLSGLEKMGAKVEWQGDKTALTAADGLTGCRYRLRYPSVGATETLLMAAVLAKGETLLEGVALEPEVLDLVRFLQSCGGCIRLLPGRRFSIRGVEKLSGCVFSPVPDRIWAATVLCAAAGCGGSVTVSGIPPRFLTGLPQLLRRAGCQVVCGQDTVALCSPGGELLQGIGSVRTGPYPFFATDAAPLLSAALLRADGMTEITDTVFSNRFACANGFSNLGAQVVVIDNNRLQIGRKPCRILKGASLTAPDLRGGAALLVAGMQAEDESTLHGAELLFRGYEELVDTLNLLGAKLLPVPSL